MAKVWTILGDRLAPAEKLAPHGGRTAEPGGMARPSRVPTIMIVGLEHATGLASLVGWAGLASSLQLPLRSDAVR